MRLENDLISSVELGDNELYGIHTMRAIANFNLGYGVTNLKIIKTLAMVKKACAITNHKLNYLSDEIKDAIVYACDEIESGKHDEQFKIDALQGGAGTSTNMNINEVIANIALNKLGKAAGLYDIISPINHVNLHQSTNDVYPTAVKIAVIYAIRELADEYARLQESLQVKENEFADVLKLGRTQYMDALPIMLGQEFGAYAKAVSRDRWRIYKVEERIRTINIGGTAIGTGLNAPQKYIFLITQILQDITELGLSRDDYLIDNTQNLDVFVEISGLLKAASTTLIKIANDLRLMASGPNGGFGEITLPKVQAGSSIMPGKVNPVIPEMVVQVGYKVIANDTFITSLASLGVLELNSFLPAISDSLLESLELLKAGIILFREKCIEGVKSNKEVCLNNLEKSHSLITPLISYIGYDKATEIVNYAIDKQITIKQALIDNKLFNEGELNILLNPLNITKPGIPKLD